MARRTLYMKELCRIENLIQRGYVFSDCDMFFIRLKKVYQDGGIGCVLIANRYIAPNISSYSLYKEVEEHYRVNKLFHK